MLPRGMLLLVAVSTFGALLLAACGGDATDNDGPLRPRGTTQSHTPTPELPDTDGDGIPDETDACPDAAERPGGVDVEAPDGCPDSLDELVAFAVEDINTYWQNRLRGIGVGYYEPAVTPYTEEILTPCGLAELDNALYCGFDNGIYYDAGLFLREFEQNGDFAPIFILAHEWGHLVQAHVGFFALDLYGIDYELQADCMAGVYARNADQRDLLALGDLDEAAATLLNFGDDAEEVKWYDPGAHGTAEERTNAFMQGFEKGLSVCASVSAGAKER